MVLRLLARHNDLESLVLEGELRRRLCGEPAVGVDCAAAAW
jgi:hypothetical protein